MATILPNVVEVAKQHGLTIKTSTIGKKETLCKCPFCQTKGFHLSLNEDLNVFKCWSCHEHGGVLHFISLLDRIPESKIKQAVLSEHGIQHERKKSPAERLTHRQLRMIGFSRINWDDNRKYDPQMAHTFEQKVYHQWLEFVATQKELAHRQIFTGIITGHYEEAIKRVKEMEVDLDWKILEDVLKELSKSNRPQNLLEQEMFAAELTHRVHPLQPFLSQIKNQNEKVGHQK